MKTLLQDIRFGLRMLRKSPGFTAVAIITLALAIGANTTIFSLINAIMLRTLPVRDPQSLVLLRWAARGAPNPNAHPNAVVWDGCPGDNGGACSFSYPMFQQIQAEKEVFSGVFAFLEEPGTVVNANGRISRASGLLVSGNFFPTLGVQPTLGRLLDPADDSSTAAPVVVVSYSFWQNVLGGDRAAVGKSVMIGKAPFTIVGVTGPQLLQLDPGLATDYWAPFSSQPTLPKTAANFFWLQIMARVKTGISVSQAAAATSTVFAASTTTGPNPIFAPGDVPHIELPTAAYGEASLRQSFSRPLYVLLAAVALVLLIACANVAGLMLARSTVRRKEIAVRAALGASRGRIIRQLLTESLMLSAAGGAFGVLIGYWGADGVAAFLTWNRTWFIPLQVDVHPDARVFLFALLVSTVVGLTFGLAPAFSSGKVELVPALKEGTISSAGASRGSRTTLGNALIVAQMALAMLVLVGAGLLVRTFTNLKAVNPGFDPQNLLLFTLDTTYSNRTGGNLQILYPELQEQLAGLPGVTSVSHSGGPPLSGMVGVGKTHILTEDQPASPIQVDVLSAGSNFFKTMRIPILAGHTFNAQDSAQNQSGKVPDTRPIVINEKLAHLLSNSQSPVGRFFSVGGRTTVLSVRREVLGVVGDARTSRLRDAVMPTIYLPLDNNLGTVEIRTATDPNALIPEVRAAIGRFDPNLLVTDMKTQMEQIDQNIYQERLVANLSSLFALLALIVACVGIYGLLSYQVTRRTQEIGIRLALGAQRGDVLRIVLRQGAVLAILGALIGVGAALAVTRYLQSFLFGVKPSDPTTIVGVAFLLIAVALLASYIPARRAMKTDPIVALRYE